MMKKLAISQLGDINVIMDWAHIREFVSHDTGLEAEILTIFCDNAPNYITEISAANAEDWPSACHKLKGAARTIGAWSLAFQTEQAELNAPVDKDAESRQNIIASLGASLDSLVKEIKSEHNTI